MKYSTEDIISFLIDQSGTDKIKPDSDMFEDIRMGGNDFHEMIEEYAKRFSVDMDGYLWYFHADEEGGPGLGGILFKPPYERVQRIPVTPLLLTDFANKGRWDMKYPEHELPKKRYDLLINTIILGIFLLVFIIWGILKIIN